MEHASENFGERVAGSRARDNKGVHEPKKRVFLVDDHPLTREGFAQLVNQQGDLEVCGQAGTAANALTAVEALKPDAVIVDISLAAASGLELIKDLSTRHPRLPSLVVSAHDEMLFAERSLRAGARGYAMKSEPTHRIIAAIRQVLQGKIFLSEQMHNLLLNKVATGTAPANGSDFDRLSDRELEVFRLIGEGRSTRKIAADLHVSISTIGTHRTHIMHKLAIQNSVELVRRAVEWVTRRQT